ncbi:MAG: hypothetical protein R3F65_09630 [bacterium]|nr:hypothetical protein [Myxococcales bacterium]
MRPVTTLLFALACALLAPACGGAPERGPDADGARNRAAEQDRDLQRKLDDKRARED